MKKLLTAATVGAMLTGGVAIAMQTPPTSAPQAPHSKAEMLARADARFDRLDTDKDGQLSAQERSAGMERPRAARAARYGGDKSDLAPGAGRRGGGGMSEKMLARIDINGDEMISRAENRAAAEARFARMDVDKDGTIEAGEFGADGERIAARGERRGPGAHGGHDRGGTMMADANGDGAVTRAEFDAASAQRFARMDSNGDGKLDAADRPQRRTAPPSPPAPGAD